MNDGDGQGAAIPSSPLPRIVQVASLLAIVLLWPVAFLARTLLALYLPWARIWLALAVAAFSVLIYGIRLVPSMQSLKLDLSRPTIRKIVIIALSDSLQNLSLMIGSGCVPAPLSCLIPLIHVHLKRRPDSIAAAALAFAGVVLLVAVTFEHIRLPALALICTSPLFVSYSTATRVAVLDHIDSFTLQWLSSALQIPIWVVLYPVASRLQAAVLPLATRFHPVSSALFVQHDPAYIGTVCAVLLLLALDFVVVWRLRAKSALSDGAAQPWVQYASRGADLLLVPSASPRQAVIATVVGAAAGFVLAGLMVPQRSHLILPCVGAVLILAGSAIQMQSPFSSAAPVAAVEEIDMPLMP